MSPKTDGRSPLRRVNLRDRWNDFVRTMPGDAFAALLTIVVMFGAMFGFAFAVMLGSDGVQMLLRPH